MKAVMLLAWNHAAPPSCSSSSSSAAALQVSVPCAPIRCVRRQRRARLYTAAAASASASAQKVKTVMTPEQRMAWSEGLPVVTERIAFTDILDLKTQGRLKYVIKHPRSKPKTRPDVVFVVLDDNRVLRTVLPPAGHQQFWFRWDSLAMNSLIINAYSPPTPKPSVPSSSLVKSLVNRLLLPAFTDLEQKQTQTQTQKKKRKDEKTKIRKKSDSATASKIEEVLRVRMEAEKMRKATEEELRAIQAELKQQRKMQAQEQQRQSGGRTRGAKQEEEENEQMSPEERQSAIQMNQEIASMHWDSILEDENFLLFLAFGIFVLFYRVVVLGYKKRRKDYEDRLKIQQLEDEERAKNKQLDREMDMALDAKKKQSSTSPTGLEKQLQDNPYLEVSLQFLSSGAKVRRAGITSRYLDRNVNVKFEDVAGLGNIRKELEEIVEFFRYPERYRGRGAKIPSGILLCGEPGVGKTLLAKAVAGEAGASFLSISASQFVEMFVGVGASRVRALYDEARANAPAVVFIDELDAVGRQRGLISTSGGKERDNTVNQLLVCLDGFEGKGEVITIAATNRPDILDSALIRPGRFDRRIYIPLPGLAGRIEILKVHMRNKPVAEDIDYEAVASATGTVSGAELANIVNKAALSAIRKGQSEITTKDLILATQGDDADSEGEYSLQIQKKLALNEAAMAVVAASFPDFKNIKMLSIAPMFQTGIGCVRVSFDETRFEVPSYSRQTVIDYITVQLASRAADEMRNGHDQMCTLSAEMFDNARSTARWLILAGLSDKTELYGVCDCWHEAAHLNDVDAEALRILNVCYERAKEILQRNQRLVDVLINELMTKQTVKKVEFLQLVNEFGDLDTVPPEPIEIRNYRLAKSQNAPLVEALS